MISFLKIINTLVFPLTGPILTFGRKKVTKTRMPSGDEKILLTPAVKPPERALLAHTGGVKIHCLKD